MCRRSSQIVSLVIALLCGGVTRGASPVVVPNLPPSDFVDTEIVTNVPFSAGGAQDREFVLSIALAASASNDVEVALGVDADANGMLGRTEVDLVVGWDCDGWGSTATASQGPNVTKAANRETAVWTGGSC